LHDALRHQRDLLCDGLAALGFEVYRPAATYFATTDVRGLGAGDGTELCRLLPERCGVVAIPSSVFYDDKESSRYLVRWAFCKRPEVLEEALARLKGLTA
jgi:N-succinyldiaminopimelate aminotransferase